MLELTFDYICVDHPVHAPGRSNPWICESSEPKNYLVKPVRGVFHVYKDKEALDKDEAISYPYPDLDMFVSDMNKLCTMIADGPL